MTSEKLDKDSKGRFSSGQIIRRVLAFLIVFTLLFSLFIYVFLDPIVKNRIIKSVHNSSEGLYVLEIGELDAKFWTGAITMKEVWLRPDARDLALIKAKDTSTYIPNVNIQFDSVNISSIGYIYRIKLNVYIQFDSVNISSIGWFRYLLNRKKLEIGRVLIDKPDFIIHTDFSGKNIQEKNRNFLDYLPGIIAAFTGSLRIEEIFVKDGHMHYDLHGKDGVVHQLADSIYLDLKKISIDTISPKNTLYSEEAYIDFRNYNLSTPDNLHTFKIAHISGNVRDSVLHLHGIYYSQKDSLKERYRDDITVSMTRIESRGVDYENLLRDQKIFLRTMIFKSPVVELHSSENPVTKYSKDKTQGKGDQTILDELIPYLSGSFRIDTLSVENGKIHYQIINPEKQITQSARNIYMHFSRVAVDTNAKGSKIYAENMSLRLKDYFLKKDTVSELNISSLQASLHDSILKLHQLKFKSNNKDSYFFKAEEVYGQGIDYMSMLEQKKAQMDILLIKKPEIKMVSVDDNKIKKKYESPKLFFRDALGPLADASLRVKKFMIEDATVNHKIIRDSGVVEQNAQRVFVSIINVKGDSASAEKFNFFDSFFIDMENYEVKVHKENFKLSINHFKADSKAATIEMKDISLSQLMSFGQFQRYYFINTIKSANASGFDYDRFIQKQEVHTRTLNLDSMRLEIFLDAGKVVRPSFAHRMPQELMQKIKFYLRIDTLNLDNSYIAYSDLEPGILVPGLLTFEKMKLKIYKLTNDSKIMTDSTPAQLMGHAMIMGEGDLQFQISLPLLSKKFDAHYGGTLGTMNGQSFNSLLAFGGIRLTSGEIAPSKFDVTIVNGIAMGELEFVYQNLHVKLLDEEQHTRKLYSKLGNFAIKNNNPNDKREAPEKVGLCARLTEEDSFFYFMWRVIRTGIIETVTKSTIYRVKNEK